MSFLLASAARATTGGRSGQEDAYRLWPAEGVAQPEGEKGGLLAVLADGMGGHTGGAVAGETACSTFADVFASAASSYDQRLQSALQASNEALAKGVEENAALRGMGCTLVAAWMDTFGIRWTSVGDSLLLLYRFPDVIRLNADHSLGSFLDEQARQNRISESEAKQHHNRNALRSALTGAKIDLIDLRSEPLELRPGDWILLASDGICSLQGDEIADVIYNFRQSTPEEMAAGLIAAVVGKGVVGQDNTTVVAVRIDPAKTASDAETTRVLRGRGKEEKELRSRRIGRTGRKTSIPRRAAGRSKRSAIWLVAAAVFILFFAATVLLRLLPATPPIAPEAATPVPSQPAAAAAPADTPDTTAPDAPRPPAPVAPGPATPEAPQTTAPDASQPQVPPVPQKVAPPTPQKVPPATQRAAPVQPSPTAPPESQAVPPSPPPSQAPSTQSGEAEEVTPRTDQVKRPLSEQDKQRRARRQEQAKDGAKDAPKGIPKDVPKKVPKEAVKEAPSGVPLSPWGYN